MNQRLSMPHRAFSVGWEKEATVTDRRSGHVDGETVPWDRPLKAGASVTFDLSPFETPDFSPEPEN
jgi:hypothetical protein